MNGKIIKNMKALYKKAKAAKVGEIVVCPACGNKFKKTHYAQAFCRKYGKTVCKDYYWNNVTESKRNNTTRISPANAAWQERMKEREYFEDYDPGDSEYWDQKDCH